MTTTIGRARIGALVTFFAWGAGAQALTLDEYLERVQKTHGVYLSTKLAQKTAPNRNAQGDLQLSPYLTASASYIDDQKYPTNPYEGDRTKVANFSLGVAKKFTTGTAASLTLSDRHIISVTGLSFPFQPLYLSGLSLGVSQSLLKDGFGRSMRLRHERETLTEKLEKVGLEVQARQILINAEVAYWNGIAQAQELKIRKDSLDRAERLVKWMQRRVSNGLSDRSDLLQTQGLLGSRQLLLIGAEDEEKAAQKALADFIGEKDVSGQSLDTPFKTLRPDSFEKTQDPLRADALLGILEAQVKGQIAGEVDEGLKPDLSVSGSLATNAKESGWGSSLGSSPSTSRPTAIVAMSFSMDLDPVGKSKVRAVAASDAEISRLKAERLKLESDSSWSELKRRYQQITRRIETAQDLVKIQVEKSSREQLRFERGRTTTFQVINFEQDVAEAESMLLKLQIEQRKLEAQAKMFVSAAVAHGGDL